MRERISLQISLARIRVSTVPFVLPTDSAKLIRIFIEVRNSVSHFYEKWKWYSSAKKVFASSSLCLIAHIIPQDTELSISKQKVSYNKFRINYVLELSSGTFWSEDINDASRRNYPARGNDRDSRDPWVIKLLHFRGDHDEKEMNRDIPALISRGRMALLCPASSYIVFRTDFRPGFVAASDVACEDIRENNGHPASLTRTILSFNAPLKWTSASSLCRTWRAAWNNSYFRATKWTTYRRVILSIQHYFQR